MKKFRVFGVEFEAEFDKVGQMLLLRPKGTWSFSRSTTLANEGVLFDRRRDTLKTRQAIVAQRDKMGNRVVCGVKMSPREYLAFVDYLNQNNVQSFTRADVVEWLKCLWEGK